MEQHRLKCNIGGVNLSGSPNMMGDMAKNSVTFLNNGDIIDSDRKWLHVTNSVSKTQSINSPFQLIFIYLFIYLI